MPADHQDQPLGRGSAGPRHRRRLGVLAVALLLVAAGCTDGGDAADEAPGGASTTAAPSTEAATVIAWARTDLGFGDAADCMAHYLVGIELEGATRADLQRRGLDAVPLGARGRIGDALVVCGIRGSGR